MAGPYQASKYAARAVAESLHHDLRSQGAAIGVTLLCPGPVATEIARSTRNRPAGLAAGADAPDAAAVAEFCAATTAGGRDPLEVADMVLAAVDDGRFYVLTEDRYDDHLRVVCDDLLARRPPTSVGFT
jgi:NAD(P)-dependent dehydrogenase (short-subunit alcohol dehydrogenase family)